MVAIGAIAAVGLVAAIRDDRQKTTTLPASSASGTPARQQPGPAPAGKVWSAEHGHWHDQRPAAGTSSPIKISPPATAPSAPATTPKAQPPGPAPAGQVWSAEHGHWHDARTP